MDPSLPWALTGPTAPPPLAPKGTKVRQGLSRPYSLGPEVIRSQLGIVNLQDQPCILSLGQQDLGDGRHQRVATAQPSKGRGEGWPSPEPQACPDTAPQDAEATGPGRAITRTPEVTGAGS